METYDKMWGWSSRRVIITFTKVEQVSWLLSLSSPENRSQKLRLLSKRFRWKCQVMKINQSITQEFYGWVLWGETCFHWSVRVNEHWNRKWGKRSWATIKCLLLWIVMSIRFKVRDVLDRPEESVGDKLFHRLMIPFAPMGNLTSSSQSSARCLLASQMGHCLGQNRSVPPKFHWVRSVRLDLEDGRHWTSNCGWAVLHSQIWSADMKRCCRSNDHLACKRPSHIPETRFRSDAISRPLQNRSAHFNYRHYRTENDGMILREVISGTTQKYLRVNRSVSSHRATLERQKLQQYDQNESIPQKESIRQQILFLYKKLLDLFSPFANISLKHNLNAVEKG
jgi:hypothetical protein